MIRRSATIKTYVTVKVGGLTAEESRARSLWLTSARFIALWLLNKMIVGFDSMYF